MAKSPEPSAELLDPSRLPERLLVETRTPGDDLGAEAGLDDTLEAATPPSAPAAGDSS